MKLTLGKKYLLATLALLLLAMGSLYLIPVGHYLPEIEQVASQKLHAPVNIVSLNLAAFPLPHLKIHGVEVGGVKGITVQTIAVTPDFARLLSGALEVREIAIEHASIDYLFLQKLLALQKNTASTGKSAITLRELKAQEVTLVAPWATLKGLEAHVSFDDAGKLSKIWGAMDQQHLTATLLPAANQHFSVAVTGKDWAIPTYPRMVLHELQLTGMVSERDFVAQKMTAALGNIELGASGTLSFGKTFKIAAQLNELTLPLAEVDALLEKPLGLNGMLQLQGQIAGTGNSFTDLQKQAKFMGTLDGKDVQMRLSSTAEKLLLLDDLNAQVTALATQVNLNQIQATLYDGKLTGSIGLAGTQLQADLNLSDLEMAELVGALTNRVLFSGKLAGNSQMSVALNELPAFPKGAQIKGNFHIQKGVLRKVDLVKAANASAATETDSTEFDDFTGVAQVDATGYHFQKLALTSGVLKATGEVNLTPSMALSGDLDADLKGTLGLVSVPLVISGTVEKPVVLPNGAFLAGAAVGTAVLPGIGTVVGMKVGGLLNKIFKGNSTSAVPAR